MFLFVIDRSYFDDFVCVVKDVKGINAISVVKLLRLHSLITALTLHCTGCHIWHMPKNPTILIVCYEFGR